MYGSREAGQIHRSGRFAPAADVVMPSAPLSRPLSRNCISRAGRYTGFLVLPRTTSPAHIRVSAVSPITASDSASGTWRVSAFHTSVRTGCSGENRTRDIPVMSRKPYHLATLRNCRGGGRAFPSTTPLYSLAAEAEYIPPEISPAGRGRTAVLRTSGKNRNQRPARVTALVPVQSLPSTAYINIPRANRETSAGPGN